MRIICARCNFALIIQRVGAPVVEMFDDPPRPYKIWSSDVMGCPECDLQIAVMSGSGPIAEHHEDKFRLLFEEAKKREPIFDYERFSP